MKITVSESLILDALWRADRPLAIQDLPLALKKAGWKDGTLRAFLARMLRKKAVAAQRAGKRRLLSRTGPPVNIRDGVGTSLKRSIP